MKRVFFQTILAAFLVLLVSLPIQAQIPKILNFEGVLRDLNGNPVPDGSYSVTFSIYDSISGGTSLWTETWNGSTSAVATKEGMFSVQLGTHNPFELDFFSKNSNTYLGIQVGLDPEMVPRQQISSVAYAFTAGSGGIPSGGIIMWSGSANNIPLGWELCDGDNGTPNLKDKFIVGAGNIYAANSTGGTIQNSISHSHSIGSDAVSLTDGAHSHTLAGAITLGVKTDNENDPEKHCTEGSGQTKNVASMSHRHWVVGNTAWDGAHSHTSNSHNHGGETAPALNTIDNRPPYYALCFIMKK